MQLVGATLLTLGALLLTLYALRWVQRRMGAGSATAGMEVLGRMGIAPKQGVTLLRVGERVLAVSVGEGGVRTLAEFTGAEAVALISESESRAPMVALPRVFERVRGISAQTEGFQSALRRERGAEVQGGGDR